MRRNSNSDLDSGQVSTHNFKLAAIEEEKTNPVTMRKAQSPVNTEELKHFSNKISQPGSISFKDAKGEGTKLMQQFVTDKKSLIYQQKL